MGQQAKASRARLVQAHRRPGVPRLHPRRAVVIGAASVVVVLVVAAIVGPLMVILGLSP